MLFNCLSAVTGMWLLMTPFLWTDQPARSGAAALAGLAVVVLAPLAVAAPRLNRGLVALGACLGVLNFFLPGGIGSMANFAASGLILILAGQAPTPRLVEAAATAAPAEEKLRPEPVCILPERFAA